ncbi:hypothetical protein STENM223S_09781 [Streptomyces tendae]
MPCALARVAGGRASVIMAVPETRPKFQPRPRRASARARRTTECAGAAAAVQPAEQGGDGATLLLHDVARGTVLLTRQFRLPAYVNGHPDGMLIEAAAGLLDGDSAEEAVRREAAEETGRRIGEVEHVFDVYMSPGSVTERLHFFAAPYESTTAQPGDMRGVADEGEDIEVLELPFSTALAMIRRGEIADAKTIMLLQWAALDGPFKGISRPA